MSNVVISPNMGLPVPIVGTDPGPDWANNLNASLSIVDGHTHTSGSGVAITPQAININSDLTMNGNNLTSARTVRFLSQSSAPSNANDLGCLFIQGGDAWYVNGAGVAVQITSGNSIVGSAGSISGLPSGTASASFATGTFTFQSATNTPASLNVGPITLGQQVASGKNVTFTANASQVTNYGYTLPLALPVVNSSAIVSDTSGNLTYLKVVTATDTVAGLTVNPTTYQVGTTYNAVLLSVTGSGAFSGASVTTESWMIPYQTTDGSWHLRFSIYFTLGSPTNSGTLTIAGVTFVGSTLKQAVAVAATNFFFPAIGWANPGAGTLNLLLQTGNTNDDWALSGDVKLASKPTWAN